MTLWEAAAFLVILGAAGFFTGLLLYKAIGGALAVSRAGRKARAELARTMAGLSTEQLQQRLLQDRYLAGDLRDDATIQAFLRRVAQGDAVALAREYPRPRLYKLLATAETSLGHRGRPQAVDSITEVSAVLQELARRSRAHAGR
jgi:hypothetical protein